MRGCGECVLYDRACVKCGECDRCDLDPQKICDNCMRCVRCGDADFRAIRVDGILMPGDTPAGEGAQEEGV